LAGFSWVSLNVLEAKTQRVESLPKGSATTLYRVGRRKCGTLYHNNHYHSALLRPLNTPASQPQQTVCAFLLAWSHGPNYRLFSGLQRHMA